MKPLSRILKTAAVTVLLLCSAPAPPEGTEKGTLPHPPAIKAFLNDPPNDTARQNYPKSSNLRSLWRN